MSITPFRAGVSPASPNVTRACRRQAHNAPVDTVSGSFWQTMRYVEMGEKEWIRERITLWGSNSITRASSRFTPGRTHHIRCNPAYASQIPARQSLGTRYSCASQSCFNETIPRATGIRERAYTIHGTPSRIFSRAFLDRSRGVFYDRDGQSRE